MTNNPHDPQVMLEQLEMYRRMQDAFFVQYSSAKNAQVEAYAYRSMQWANERIVDLEIRLGLRS